MISITSAFAVTSDRSSGYGQIHTVIFPWMLLLATQFKPCPKLSKGDALFAAGCNPKFVVGVSGSWATKSSRDSTVTLDRFGGPLTRKDDPTWLIYFAPDNRPKTVYAASLFSMIAIGMSD